MVVIEVGMEIEVRPHELKILSLMVFTEVGMMIEVREVQERNAELLIVVTEVGMMIDVREVQI